MQAVFVTVLQVYIEGVVEVWPVLLIELNMRLCEMGTNSTGEDIVLDFFSGSASTAHAVMRLGQNAVVQVEHRLGPAPPPHGAHALGLLGIELQPAWWAIPGAGTTAASHGCTTMFWPIKSPRPPI